MRLHKLMLIGCFLLLTAGARAQLSFLLSRPLVTEDSTVKFIKVLQPEKKARWFLGKTYDISWVSNFPEQVQIDLYRNDIFYGTLSPTTPNRIGESSLQWNIPVELPQGANFQLQITSLADNLVRTMSEPFAIRKEFRGRRIALICTGAVVGSATAFFLIKQAIGNRVPDLPAPPDPQ